MKIRSSIGRNCIQCNNDDWYHYPNNKNKPRCARCYRSYQYMTPEKQKGYRLRRKYNMTVEMYNQLLQKQNGGCAICGRKPKTKPLNVDHCHKTGKIRGLLCPPCNRSLGILGDNEDSLLKVIDYLRKTAL